MQLPPQVLLDRPVGRTGKTILVHHHPFEVDAIPTGIFYIDATLGTFDLWHDSFPWEMLRGQFVLAVDMVDDPGTDMVHSLLKGQMQLLQMN